MTEDDYQAYFIIMCNNIKNYDKLICDGREIINKLELTLFQFKIALDTLNHLQTKGDIKDCNDAISFITNQVNEMNNDLVCKKSAEDELIDKRMQYKKCIEHLSHREYKHKREGESESDGEGEGEGEGKSESESEGESEGESESDGESEGEGERIVTGVQYITSDNFQWYLT